MASITSVISLFVLLLATYCYSLPIDPVRDISKPIHDVTTGRTIVNNEKNGNMELVTEEGSTVVPNIDHSRSPKHAPTSETPSQVGKDGKRGLNDDVTSAPETSTSETQSQVGQGGKRGLNDDVTSSSETSTLETQSEDGKNDKHGENGNVEKNGKRSLNDDVTSSSETSTSETQSEDGKNDKHGENGNAEKNGKRSLNDDLSSTMESSTQSEQSAGKSNDGRPEKEEEESSSKGSRSVDENEPGMQKNDESSADSLAHITALLDECRTAKKPTEPEQKEPSKEEPETGLSGNEEGSKEIISVTPGKTTETKIYDLGLAKFVLGVDRTPDQKNQLNQGQGGSDSEKEE